MKKIVVLVLIVCLSSCNKKNDEKVNKTNEIVNNDSIDTISQKQTFAVVTSFATEDKQKFNDHIQKQTSQLDSLWNEGVVENIYYNPNTKFGANDKLGSVVFFIKADNEDEAKSILNKTDFIVNNIGKYNLYPVGSSWLNMSDKAGDTRLAKGKVFVTVWSLNNALDKIDPKTIENQFNADLKLFNDGIIENAYLVVNTKDSQKIPAVYFINATDEKEAKSLLNNLPLIKSKDGKYELHEVGSFMKATSK